MVVVSDSPHGHSPLPPAAIQAYRLKQADPRIKGDTRQITRAASARSGNDAVRGSKVPGSPSSPQFSCGRRVAHTGASCSSCASTAPPSPSSTTMAVPTRDSRNVRMTSTNIRGPGSPVARRGPKRPWSQAARHRLPLRRLSRGHPATVSTRSVRSPSSPHRRYPHAMPKDPISVPSSTPSSPSLSALSSTSSTPTTPASPPCGRPRRASRSPTRPLWSSEDDAAALMEALLEDARSDTCAPQAAEAARWGYSGCGMATNSRTEATSSPATSRLRSSPSTIGRT